MKKTKKQTEELPTATIDQAHFEKFANGPLLLKCFEVVKDATEFVDEGGTILHADDTYVSFIEAYWALKVLFQRETGLDAKLIAEKRIENLRAALFSGGEPEPIVLGSPKVERLVLLEEPYFNQFDNLTLAAMSYNDTDEAHDQFSGSGDTPLDADATWNVSVSILNANTALRVLVLRLSGGTLNDMAQIVAHISNPKGEAIH
ncbi:hypothetical protein HBO43_22295 [Pseudomonas veronii]|uniref:Uncharacterized protein n=1 Tax=Pseudomonas veronii TaxID=76761 RepID=A0A7Y0ZWK4_PSEVE|nr:hypothetical protein [Pseudomonas veronii]NMX99324.1 hypothetical protein [Pseudomonas veronii]